MLTGASDGIKFLLYSEDFGPSSEQNRRRASSGVEFRLVSFISTFLMRDSRDWERAAGILDQTLKAATKLPTALEASPIPKSNQGSLISLSTGM